MNRNRSATRVVFTAVDGTLLDPGFDPGPSRAMLRRLHAARVPVVPVTYMTFDEMEPLAHQLGLRHAMIVEGGGAIARWIDGEWEIEPCGPEAGTLLDVVREIEEISGAGLLVYSALPPSEAARLSGRTGEMLERSTHRCFSEPFVIESGDLAEVIQAAESIGFTVRRGGGFLHLCRAQDEGAAFRRLREELHCDVAIALGSSPLDANFLAAAEIPIVVPRADGQPDPGLLAKVQNARIAPAPGAAGWAAAIEELWPVIVAESATDGARPPSSGPARTALPHRQSPRAPMSRTSDWGS